MAKIFSQQLYLRDSKRKSWFLKVISRVDFEADKTTFHLKVYGFIKRCRFACIVKWLTNNHSISFLIFLYLYYVIVAWYSNFDVSASLKNHHISVLLVWLLTEWFSLLLNDFYYSNRNALYCLTSHSPAIIFVFSDLSQRWQCLKFLNCKWF